MTTRNWPMEKKLNRDLWQLHGAGATRSIITLTRRGPVKHYHYPPAPDFAILHQRGREKIKITFNWHWRVKNCISAVLNDKYWYLFLINIWTIPWRMFWIGNHSKPIWNIPKSVSESIRINSKKFFNPACWKSLDNKSDSIRMNPCESESNFQTESNDSNWSTPNFQPEWICVRINLADSNGLKLKFDSYSFRLKSRIKVDFHFRVEK